MNIDVKITQLPTATVGIDLHLISGGEREWIDSLQDPFNSIFVADTMDFELFFLNPWNKDARYNIHGDIIVYAQKSHINELERSYNTRGNKKYYINQPMYHITGKLTANRQLVTLNCKSGLLHDASGKPALKTWLLGDEYFLWGQRYEPNEYFELLEHMRNNNCTYFEYKYPEYDHNNYIGFIAKTLGEKA